MPTHADQLRLLDLQALDTRASQLRHAKATHPTLARIAELEAQIADLHGSLVDSRTAVKDLQRDVTKAEDDVAKVIARAERDQQRIDYGGISAKDTLALVEDLAALGHRREILEETQLELMEKLEAHQEALAGVEKAQADLLAEKAAVEGQRDAAFQEINAEGRAAVTERAAIAATIDAALVSTYEQIRARKDGVGAAVLRAGRCEGCALQLTASDLDAARSTPLDQVIRCEECGRILVRLADLTAA
ncbi:MAG: C4-type zinc ribbon domain-containing protein [Promicromonosporaceae bacterium]|nr:C4-type zinc ribbon domain-containing protein [Promicromonosporaceae bacterium]